MHILGVAKYCGECDEFLRKLSKSQTNRPISVQCSISIPPENVRKPEGTEMV